MKLAPLHIEMEIRDYIQFFLPMFNSFVSSFGFEGTLRSFNSKRQFYQVIPPQYYIRRTRKLINRLMFFTGT